MGWSDVCREDLSAPAELGTVQVLGDVAHSRIVFLEDLDGNGRDVGDFRSPVVVLVEVVLEALGVASDELELW